MGTHYAPTKPTGTVIFQSMLHQFAQFTDEQFAAFRPRTEMQRRAYRQETQRRGMETFS